MPGKRRDEMRCELTRWEWLTHQWHCQPHRSLPKGSFPPNTLRIQRIDSKCLFSVRYVLYTLNSGETRPKMEGHNGRIKSLQVKEKKMGVLLTKNTQSAFIYLLQTSINRQVWPWNIKKNVSHVNSDQSSLIIEHIYETLWTSTVRLSLEISNTK